MSNVKATIQNVDEGGTFTVQFNPKEFKLDEKANWKASDEHQKDKPLLTYEKGEPSVLTVDLVFDTTDGGNVYTQFVKPLRALLTADVSKSDGQGNQIKRPPYLIFSWGGFTMNCVCEKLSTTFLMFDTGGQPIRAKVQVALKERDKPNHGSTASSGSGVVLSAGMLAAGGAGSAAYVAQPGDTLSRIASKTRAKPEDIALANNIPDPTHIPAGTRMVIPANSTVAQVLAQQSRRRQEGNWRTTAAGGPGPRARGGSFGSVPSAFDETPPVAQDYDVRPGGIADQFASFGPMTYETRTDSQLAGGTAGTRTALESLDGNLAGDFRNMTDGDEGFARAATQTYDHDSTSQVATGTAGTRTALESLDGNLAGDFRNTADGDEGFARAATQQYDHSGHSDLSTGTAGTRTALGEHGESDVATGSGGQGAGGGYGGAEGGLAGAFRDTSNHGISGFDRAAAQGYDHQGNSDTATGSGGQGAGSGYGGAEGGLAGAFRDQSNHGISGFDRAAGQGYGGQGESSDATGSGGDGIALGGGREGGLAGAFRDDSHAPTSGFDRAAGQTIAHGDSSDAGGTAGDGAQLGGFRSSGEAGSFRDESRETTGFRRPDGEVIAHAPSEGAAGTAGDGAAASADGAGGDGAAAGAGGAQLGGGGGGAREGRGGAGARDGDFGAAFRAAKEAAERTKKGD